MNPRPRWRALIPARELAALGALLAITHLPLRAETLLAVPTAPGSDVTIKLALPSAQPPRFGFAPVRVTIENAAPLERSWQVRFQSGVRGQFPGPVGFERTFTVPAGRTMDAWVYVPVAEPGTPGGAPTLSAGGIAAGAAPSGNPGTRVNIVTGPPGSVSSTGGFGPPTRVTITPTPVGTKITRVVSLSGGKSGASYTEEREIDLQTGVITTTTLAPNGTPSGTPRTSSPLNPGTKTTFTINPSTGSIGTTTRIAASPTAPPKVTVVTGPASGSVASATPPRGPAAVTPGPRLVP